MTKFTNNTNISLSMATWLATDKYDHNPDPNTISVTTLIKGLKKTILGMRIPPEDDKTDLISLLKSQIGTAVHDAVEQSWLTNHKQAMLDLGYPESVSSMVKVNPSKDDLKQAEASGEVIIPVYMEKRSEKEIEGMKVTGKFDFCAEGKLEDVKCTTVYTYINKSNDKDYILQGSIYRWLNPDIITDDFITIQYVFLDWRPGDQKRTRGYPPQMQMPYKLPLMSIPETENYVRNRIRELKKYMHLPEDRIPQCTPEELWQSPSVWKYYKNPQKTARSTANFKTSSEAYDRYHKDGSVGLVKEVVGEAKACAYCPGFAVCKQKNNYL